MSLVISGLINDANSLNRAMKKTNITVTVSSMFILMLTEVLRHRASDNSLNSPLSRLLVEVRVVDTVRGKSPAKPNSDTPLHQSTTRYRPPISQAHLPTSAFAGPGLLANASLARREYFSTCRSVQAVCVAEVETNGIQYCGTMLEAIFLPSTT